MWNRDAFHFRTDQMVLGAILVRTSKGHSAELKTLDALHFAQSVPKFLRYRISNYRK
jgi:hypothetical protein